MYSVFWLIGGLTLPAVNAFGKLQLYGDRKTSEADERTSLLAGFLVLGIATGCATAGWISGKKINFRLVPWGCWGMVTGLMLLSLVGWLGTETETAAPVLSETTVGIAAKLLLAGMGIAAGVFTVPLQVFLQSRPPSDQKGRVIGRDEHCELDRHLVFGRNLRWLRFFARSVRRSAFRPLRRHVALFLIPVALFYRPQETTTARMNVPPACHASPPSPQLGSPDDVGTISSDNILPPAGGAGFPADRTPTAPADAVARNSVAVREFEPRCHNQPRAAARYERPGRRPFWQFEDLRRGVAY